MWHKAANNWIERSASSVCERPVSELRSMRRFQVRCETMMYAGRGSAMADCNPFAVRCQAVFWACLKCSLPAFRVRKTKKGTEEALRQ